MNHESWIHEAFFSVVRALAREPRVGGRDRGASSPVSTIASIGFNLRTEGMFQLQGRAGGADYLRLHAMKLNYCGETLGDLGAWTLDEDDD